MTKYILPFYFCLFSSPLFAGNGITVHALNKEFSIPDNCEFFARPAVTAGEVRFNCTFYKPIDSVTIYFSNYEHCEKYIIPTKVENSNVNKIINGIRYIEKTEIMEGGNKPVTWRIISDNEVCVYALGLHNQNLDTLLNGLWEK